MIAEEDEAMQALKESYDQKCRDFVCEPVKLFVDSIDRAVANGTVVNHIILNGNSKALFKKRLEYMQVFALAEALHDVTSVETLDLSFNFIDDAGVATISRLLKFNKSIKYLNLEGNNITSEGALKLADTLSEAGGGGGGLLALNLYGNSIGEEGAMELAKMLVKNTTLENLNVGNTEMGHKGVISIATALNQSNRTLLSLNIENPRIFSLQEETTLHVARMLAANSTLIELCMGKCKVRDVGIHTLVAYGLVRNTALQILDLRCNDITEVGGEDVSRLLQDNGNLRSINLACNRLSDNGAVKIAQALPYNHSVIDLDLSYNTVGDIGLTALAESVGFNAELSSLRLWGNIFGQSSTQAFMDAMMHPPGDRVPLITDFLPYSVGEQLQVAKTELEVA